MNENTQHSEREEDNAAMTQPNDENPGSFFCIPSAPHFELMKNVGELYD